MAAKQNLMSKQQNDTEGLLTASAEPSKQPDEYSLIMDDFQVSDDEPKVGIFWYDPEHNELFGCDDTPVSLLNGKKSHPKLHRDYWKMQQRLDHKKSLADDIFLGDYRMTPRGRIFYDHELESFTVFTGVWIRKHPDVHDLVLDYFDLRGQIVTFEIDPRWNIGASYDDR